MKEIFEVSLRFNSSKSKMKLKLDNTDYNSGVGINIGKYAHLFDSKQEYIWLEFDDGSKGKALVIKDKGNKCVRIAQDCIGAWARNNGLWERKINESSVKLFLKVLESKKKFYVFSM